MNFKLLSASLLAMSAVAGMASAQSVGAAPVYNWTGGYAGVNLGGAWGSTCSNWTPTLAGVSPVFTGGGCPNNTSIIGGGQAGYQFQSDVFVFGLEGDIGGATAHGHNRFRTTLGVPGIPAGTYGFSGNSTPSSIETIRPRIGYAVGDALFYVTGGGAFAGGSSAASVRFVPAGASTPTAFFAGSNSGTRVGWTIGGGLEYHVGGRWSVKAEDLYVNLGTLGSSPTRCSGAGCTSFGTGLTWVGQNHSLNINVFRVGVNYNFGSF
jgi:outer membrane immunogenic protein